MTHADAEQDRLAVAPMHREPPQPSIYDELIEKITDAKITEEMGSPVEALIELGAVRTRLVAYLHDQAN